MKRRMTRTEREKQTLDAMIAVYCRRHHRVHNLGPHKGTELCEECRALRDYCFGRVDSCPLGDAKTSCRKCTVHCYAPARREEIRAVMRYVGPRMLFIHPKMALLHLLSETRK